MEIKFNLLSWREMHRQKKKKKYLRRSSIGLALVLLFCLSENAYLKRQMDRQKNYNQLLKDEIALILTKKQKILKIKRQEQLLSKRLIYFEQQQINRIVITHLFDELIKIIPAGIYLKRLKGTKLKITLDGFAKSNQAVALLVQNIEHNSWMKSPNLLEIKKKKFLDAPAHFSLNFLLKNHLTQHSIF